MMRANLYKQVWEVPMMRLARTYGLSDVGLAKICRKHDIPRPPRGYWAQKQFGQTPRQAPLPKPDKNYDIALPEPGEGQGIRKLGDDVEKIMADEKTEEARIQVAETLRGCHELVSRANQELQGAKTNSLGLFILEKAALKIQVAKANLRRALLIMDAVIKALEQRGYEVRQGPQVTVLGIPVRFCIVEQMDSIKEPEEPDLSGEYRFGHSRFNTKKVPSGRLGLLIEDSEYRGNGSRKSWKDGEKQRVEDRLNAFVAGVIEFAARTKQHNEQVERERKEREEAAKRAQEAAKVRAERRRLQKAEQARVDTLLQQAKNWHTSQRLRAFIQECQRLQTERHGGIMPESDFAAWVDWASQQADRLDPLSDAPPSILDEDLGPDEPETPRNWYGGRW